jgi:dTDP-4-amino-4,6-dideoxygalactose transaminase
MKVPFFNYKRLYLDNSSSLIEIFKNTARKGKFILQDDLKTLEKSLSEKFNCYTVGVNNATDALQLLLKASNLKKNSEILVSSHTMIATASAVKFANCTPVAVDIGLDHLMSIDDIKKKITNKTSVIMPTQLNGRICDMDKIKYIAKKNNLLIIEDSAQALGAKYKNQFAGTFGVGGCISFYPAKTLGCLGDGGLVITKYKKIYNLILQMRDHGRKNSAKVHLWGYNTRLDNIQAAFLNFFLKKYDKSIKIRRKLAKLYNDNLKFIKEIDLPPEPIKDGINFDIFQNYELRVKNRDNLKKYLNKNGVGTLIQWGGFALQDFKKLGFKKEKNFTEKVMKSSLMLPMNQFLKEKDVNYVCNLIKKFYDKRS